jgi:hypothetical protein
MQRFRYIASALGLIWVVGAPAAAAELAPIKQEASTAHYRLDLQIGPTEKMFTAAETAARHPAEGEVMVSGKMSMAMPMAMMSTAPGGGTRHLEVHVYSLDKGGVVTNAGVAIALTDTGSKKVENVPVAKMYGIKEGPSDTHYGNNVSLPPGSYSIEVTVNGEKAKFMVAIPAS